MTFPSIRDSSFFSVVCVTSHPCTHTHTYSHAVRLYLAFLFEMSFHFLISFYKAKIIVNFLTRSFSSSFLFMLCIDYTVVVVVVVRLCFINIPKVTYQLLNNPFNKFRLSGVSGYYLYQAVSILSFH